MKKIISIIFAVLMVLSMSTAAFAGFTSVPKQEEKVKTITVAATLRKGYTPLDDIKTFESHKVGDKEDVVKGRIFEVDFTITNGTKETVSAKDVLTGFDISITETSSEKLVSQWEKAEDAGFNKDLKNVSVDPSETKTVTYKIYALTEKAVSIKVVYEGKALDVEGENGAVFELMAKEDTKEDTSVSTSTKEDTSAKEDISVSTKEDTSASATETTKNDYTYNAPVDDDIPDTGSSIIGGGFAILGLAAVAAAVISKKRKSNDENIT